MKVIRDLEAFRPQKPTAVTVGSFDGVHLGHQKILSDLKEIAVKNDAETVVISFEPHPKIFFNPDSDMRLLTTMDEKISLISQQNIDYLILQKFDKKFAAQTPEIFIKKLMTHLNMKDLLIGHDHRFGKNRSGTYDFIKSLENQYGFKTHKIEPVKVNGKEVSSTLIRQTLRKGAVDLAQVYLGRPYFLTGQVVHGNRLGRKLGFPTANLTIREKYKLIPRQGVYLVRSFIDNQPVYGMMNIGYRPTINGRRLIMEVHFFDYDGDLYGKDIAVYFLKRLRDEQKFPDLEALKEQLKKDAETSLEFIAKNFSGKK